MGIFRGLLVGLSLVRAGATELVPTARHTIEHAEPAHNEASSWSVHIGDRVSFGPPSSLFELSESASEYFVTLGSEAALTEEMKAHRVGGEGRTHILHLPEGPSAISLPRSGDRRSGFSALVQLKGGVVLSSDRFPDYVPSSKAAVSPHSLQELDASSVKGSMRAASGLITSSSVNQMLSELVAIGAGGSSTRSWTNEQASKLSQEFLTKQFEGMGLTTCLHEFTSHGRKLANVVAFLPGAGSAGTLVLGAHYDSRPFDAPAPGAEDNGSGVAALLSVAKAFMGGEVKPKRDVYFVGFAAEEPGLLGSAAFAGALKGQGSEIPAKCRPAATGFLQAQRLDARSQDSKKTSAIILDEVGWVTPKYTNRTINFETYDWPGTTALMDNLFQANKDLNDEPLAVVHNNHPFGSDHMSFLDLGMPAVLVINADDEGYPDYHKSTDTIKNVDMDYAAKVTKLVLGGAMRTAGVRN